MTRQRFARQTQATDIKHLAIRSSRMVQPARLAQFAHQIATSGISIMMVDTHHMLRGPIIQRQRQFFVARL